MKLHITCQYMENYGAHDWDGKGECPQHWKFKGGDEYFYPLGQFAPNAEHIEELIEYFRQEIEWSDVGSKQYIVGYAVVEDTFMTEYERSQLEYDGAIAYPAKVLELPEADVYYGA